jgi:iron complex outermembrane receptor protein
MPTARHTQRTKLLLRTSLVLFAAPGLAYAQEAETSPQVATTQNGVEDIVVTARRRTESLQDTPISITALTSDGLAARNIDTAQGIAAFTPNLTFDVGTPISGTKSSASIYIRGIGQNDFTLNTDPGVGLYVDGVYVARSVGQALDLFDVERIEVLRGPQGTLFGRNTIGGAIAVTTEKPGPTSEGELSATIGRFGRINGKGWVNAPVTDTVFVKLGVSTLNSDGYVDAPLLNKSLGGDRSIAGRAALRWLASPAFTIDVTAEYTKIREESAPNVLLFTNEASNFASYHNSVVAGGSCAAAPSPLTNASCYNDQWLANGDRVSFTAFSRSDVDIFGASLTLNWDITDNLTAKSITAYRELDTIFGRDSDLSPLLITQTEEVYDQQQWSQELQLGGQLFDDRINWLVGYYHFEETGRHTSQVSFSTGAIQSGGAVDNKSDAVFAQATFDITTRLSLTGGLRYTKETKSFTPDQFVTVTSPVFFPVGTPVLPSTRAELEFNETTPLATLLYKVTDSLNVYGSFSRGFKSGGFSQRVFPPLAVVPDFGPETVQVYELGFKFSGLNRRLRLNGAVFQSDYDDIQVSVLEGVAPITANAAKGRIRGAELELTAVPVDGLTIEGGVGYLDAKYTEIGARAAVLGLDLTDDFVKTPKWTFNVGLSYALEVGADITFTPRVDWSYRSRVENVADNNGGTPVTQPGYNLFNISADLALAEGWSVNGALLNVTDKRYITSGFFDPAFIGFAEGTLAAPFEWRLTVRKRF